MELNHINVHLVRMDPGWMLLDCGIGTPECFAVLERSLEQLKIRWADITEVVLTHCHPDHVGLAPQVLEKSGARLRMHRLEFENLRRIADVVENPESLDGEMIYWGVPEAGIKAISNAFRDVRKSFHRIEGAGWIEGGETIATAVGALEAIWTPGHAPGHLCLYNPETELLISGDHVLPTITPNIAWMPGEDMLARYIGALREVARRPVKTVVPSHGELIGDLNSRAGEIIQHHEERCANILSAMNGGCGNAYQIAGVLWSGRLTPFQQRFALFEVMAHLVYLENLGQVASGEVKGVLEWVRR
jgi:glyoxylase-like metal-dependent hydrolase (beta-lactamase superfamily II)